MGNDVRGKRGRDETKNDFLSKKRERTNIAGKWATGAEEGKKGRWRGLTWNGSQRPKSEITISF